MIENPKGAQTIPEVTFTSIFRSVGVPVVRQVFEHAEKEWASGGKGVTIPFEEGFTTLTLYSDGYVNFRLGNWGPYKLSIERARSMLDAESPPASDQNNEKL
jgi:hypothetical protein